MPEKSLSQTTTQQNDYGYINARVRAMSTALLREETFKRLLDLSDMNAIFTFLRGTDYAEDLKESESRFAQHLLQIDVFEKTLEINFKRSLDRLQRILGGEARILFDLLLERLDLKNIKTLLRYTIVQTPPPFIIKDLTFSGNIARELLENLAQSEDVGEIISKMETWGISYAVPLRKTYDEILAESPTEAGKSSFAPTVAQRALRLERSLDKFYYERMLKHTNKMNANYKLVHILISEEIDLSNVMLGLRLVKARVLPEESILYFIPGGEKIKQKQFEELINCASLDDAFECLKRLSFEKMLSSRWELYKKINDLAVFERSMDEQIAMRLYKEHRKDLMGFGIVLGYLRFKYTELTNLRIIGRSKEFGMPTDIIRGELILVH